MKLPRVAPYLSILTTFFCFATIAAANNVIQSDICVYGGTSGGVIAAVAAARLGKTVSLVLVNNHVGGMTSGGLGVTDVGNAGTISGLAKEFYQRVGQHYGSTNQVYWFEPHVAEQAFLAMLTGAGVPFYTNQQLAAVTLSNKYITQITMADGTIYQAREFIDTTYEGDLMAMAGVTFTVGRESSATYNESSAGVRSPGYSYSYDPYIIPGNTNSGLLPFVQSGSPGTVGQGDNKVQVYNYRLCLTQVATNQIPIIAPTNYSEAQYQLFDRYLAARVASDGSVALNQIIDVQTIIPNGKTDINANGELSTDYEGYNYTYPTNTYAGRKVIAQQHEDYTRGLLHYLATGTNVPANVRTSMQSWGLSKDEFQDNGGWPYQLYVREARRMVSDYVLTQNDVYGLRVASDPIALGSYSVDSHPVARLAVSGRTEEEGGLGGAVPYPFGLSYRSIIPSIGQCQNLFCTFALSASHVAFAPIRLEPAFMMTSQSAGTAAAFAIDDNVPVQQLNYSKLAAQLIADGELITWGSGQSVSTNGVILYQGNTVGVTFAGTWSSGANAGGYNNSYWHDGATGKGTKYVQYTPTLPTNDMYDVYLWWVSDPNRSTNTPVDITYPNGSTRVFVNQQLHGSQWFKIFTTNFNAGSNSTVTIRNVGTTAGTYVIANAVRWSPQGNTLNGTSAPPTVAIIASDSVAGEYGANLGRFSIVNLSGSNVAPVTVNYTIGGTASNGVDYATLPGSITIPANSNATNIFISPLGNNLSAFSATITLTLAASTNYTLTNLSSATITLLDRPLDAWLRANFTAAQFTNALVSGDSAIPAQDGLPNLVKYALGLSPFTAYTNIFHPHLQGNYLILSYPQSISATDVALTFEYSNDMKTWQSGPAWFQQISAVNQGTNQLITFQATTPLNAATTAFVRLRANRL